MINKSLADNPPLRGWVRDAVVQLNRREDAMIRVLESLKRICDDEAFYATICQDDIGRLMRSIEEVKAMRSHVRGLRENVWAHRFESRCPK